AWRATPGTPSFTAASMAFLVAVWSVPAAAGAATAGAAVAVQAAAVVVQTGMQAASEVAGSLDDNDGMKGHNQ
ncbi:hypothetical protein PV707_42020, partial [Streptomyces europaeiscabiei]|nr:hypothetical protein [Streptomyces europaeiscabiei]